MLQNYQLLHELLNPKFKESQQHYRQWLEILSPYELEAAQALDDNLKIATLVNGLHGNLQPHLLLSVKPTSLGSNLDRPSQHKDRGAGKRSEVLENGEVTCGCKKNHLIPCLQPP